MMTSAFLAFLWTAALAQGQGVQVFPAGTELIQIDVVVRDRSGDLVRGLGREDFELLEDGDPQPITHFTVAAATSPPGRIGPEGSAPAPAPSPLPVAPRARYLAFAVDDYHLTQESLRAVRRALLRFVDEQMGSADQAAIFATSGSLAFLGQFTGERYVLRRAIDRLSAQGGAAFRSLDPPRISEYQAELVVAGDEEALELAVSEILLQTFSTQQRQQPYARSLAIQQARAKARTIVAESNRAGASTLVGLEDLVRRLAPLPGRKALVLLSDGFFLGGPGRTAHFDLRRIADASTRAGVAIYSIDARGLSAATPGGQEIGDVTYDMMTLPGRRSSIEQQAFEARRGGLGALAADTGGFLVANTNDLGVGVARVLEDNETYYVLAYTPKSPVRDGRFRRIEVRVPGGSHLSIRTRGGYFAPGGAASGAAKPEEKPAGGSAGDRAPIDGRIREALGSMVPLRGVPVDLAADFVATPASGLAALVTATFDASTFGFEPDGDLRHAVLEVDGLVFDEKGGLDSSFSDRLELNLTPESLGRMLREGLTYRRGVALKPGLHQVRLAVREEGSGRIGSAVQWVEVADLARKRLALSSVVLLAETGVAAAPAEGPARGEGAPEAVDRPTRASRRFKRDEPLDFLIFVYNAKRDVRGYSDVVVQKQILSGSKAIHSSPFSRLAPVREGERMPFAERLSLASFAPGGYELRLVVNDRAAKATAEQSVRFSVE